MSTTQHVTALLGVLAAVCVQVSPQPLVVLSPSISDFLGTITSLLRSRNGTTTLAFGRGLFPRVSAYGYAAYGLVSLLIFIVIRTWSEKHETLHP